MRHVQKTLQAVALSDAAFDLENAIDALAKLAGSDAPLPSDVRARLSDVVGTLKHCDAKVAKTLRRWAA
jgi:hypothetical protein